MTPIHHDPTPSAQRLSRGFEPGSFADSLFEQMREGAALLRLVWNDEGPADFELLHANPAFARHTGLNPAPGQRLCELMPGLRHSDPHWFALFVKVARDGGNEEFECAVVALGRRFSGQLIQPQPGHVVVMLSRPELQPELQRCEQELAEQRAILDSHLVGLVRTRQRHITWANSAAQALFGYPLVELLGQTTERLYPSKADFEHFAQTALPVVRAGGVFRGESQVRLKDGSLRWFSHQATQLAPGSDDHVSSFIDITARVDAEAALRRSRARLRSTFAAMSEGVVLQQADGRIRDANPAAERILGLTRDQLLGSTSLDPQGQAIHEDGSPFPGEEHPGMVALRTGQPQCQQIMGISSPSIGQRWLSINADPVVYSGGNTPDAVVATFTDITERRRIEADLIAAVRLEAENAQVRETTRLKSLFIANMSHELKTPLNGVLGVVQLLELGLVKPGTARFNRYIAQLGSSGRQLSQLIDDILDHASLEAGRLPFRPQAVDPAHLIREVVNLVRSDVERKHLALSVEVDAALGPLTLDPLRLKQVCANYLSNAVKFTGDGGAVALRLGAEGPDHFRLEVEDTGIGIAEKDLPMLFIEFHQLSAGTTKEYCGTGLGLALTRRIVECQGGSVGVRSTPGVGSVFHAVLPRHAAAPTPPAEAGLAG